MVNVSDAALVVAALAAYRTSVTVALLIVAIIVLRWTLAQDHC